MDMEQDLNFHIDFITTASNLRAANYRIKQASRWVGGWEGGVMILPPSIIGIGRRA